MKPLRAHFLAYIVILPLLWATAPIARANPLEMRSTAQSIAIFRKRVGSNPDDYLSGTILAQLYVREAREGGGMASYERAERTVGRALAAKPDHQPALALEASILASQHRFHEALKIAYDLHLVASPQILPSALAAMGDAYMELGVYDKADAAYERLAKLGEGPSVTARMARLADVRGRSHDAVRLFSAAGRDERDDGPLPTAAAWYFAQAGEVQLRIGRIEEAKRSFGEARELDPLHEPAIVGLARVALAEGRREEAVRLYEDALAVSKEPARLHAALQEILESAGEAKLAACHGRKVMESVESYLSDGHHHHHSHEGGQEGIHHVHGRFVATYLADRGIHLEDALRIARDELEKRRDVHTLDAAAWAAFRNGRIEEAQALMNEARAPGLVDPSILYHAGMIAHARGDDIGATAALKEALRVREILPGSAARTAERVLAEASREPRQRA